MPSISIRVANVSDVDAILRCLHAAFAPFREHYSAEAYADTTLTPHTAQERLKTMSVFVAEAEGMVVGTIACSIVTVQETCHGSHGLHGSIANHKSQIANSPDRPITQSPDSTEGHLRGMAVLPECHGHGVAEQLLAAAEAELGRRGCRRITLDTTAPLQRAIRFYERHGYTASGRVTDFYGMPLYEYVKAL